ATPTRSTPSRNPKMRKFTAASELDLAIFEKEIRARSLSNGVVVNSDLSVGVALRLTWPDTSCIGPDRKTQLHEQVRAALNNLPPHIDVEVRHIPVFQTNQLEAEYAKMPAPPGLIGDILDETQQAH